MMRSFTSVRSRLTRNNNFIPVLTRSFISGVEQSMIGVVFQPFVLSLGASMSQLGFLNSLAGLGGLIPTLVAPWGGWIADQRGRKVVLLGASLAAMGAFAMYGVAGWAASLLLVLPAVILFGISQVYQPVNFALVGESVGQGRRGSAYSLIMLVVTLPGIFVPVLAGMVADRIGFAAVFPAAIALEAIAFVIIWRYLRETRKSQHTEQGWRAILKFLQRAWVPPSEIRWFFIVIGLDLFAYGMGYGLLYGLLRKQYGFSTTELGILSAVSNLTWAVVSLPIGRILDRTSVKPVMVLSEALGIPMLLIWMTQSRFEILAASMILFAITAATWIPARNVYITQTIGPARRGEMFGRLSAFSGLLAFPASFIGGFLYDHFGFAAPIAGNLVFSIVPVLVLVFLVQAPQKGEEVWQNAIPTPSE
ncbi:MAG TPA: MFS transporter [Anaerolineae bacterium]|nr:MFS transporter [Anaerolineae bacterium]